MDRTRKSPSPRKESQASTSRKPSTTASKSPKLSTSKSDPLRNPSKTSKTDSSKKLSTTSTAPAKSPSRQESVHHKEEDEEASGWTEAYLRGRMNDTDSTKELDLSNKSLGKIPPGVLSIKEAEILDVSDNPLRSIPDNIASLSSLKEIRAAGCELREISGNISRCKYLAKIDLSRNPHIATLPATMKEFSYLKYVALSNCELKSLPENLTRLATVEKLDLSKNALTTLPRPLDMLGLSGLKILILNDNAFSTIPKAIRSLGRLECLEMKRNKLNNHWGNLELHVPSKLKVLDLENNCSLRLLPGGLVNLKVIEVLNVSYCGIETLLNWIGQISTLKELYLAGNKLRALPSSFKRLINLKTLDLEGNHGLSNLPHSLRHLCKLKNKETEETKASETKEGTSHDESIDDAAWQVLKEQEISDEKTALEQEEEWRLGQTVPDEYYETFSYEISATSDTVQSLNLSAGCKLIIPPGATDEDTSVTSAVLNPHGYEGTIQLKDTELLVSDIIEMKTSGMTFSKPVKLKIPHSLPKFDCEKEYIVVTSEDEGRTWVALETLSGQEQGQRFVTVEVTHFSPFAVVAKPLDHWQRVPKGGRATLTSSKQTGIKVILLENCMSDEREISFNVTPVDEDTLTRAKLDDSTTMEGIDSMSHIINFVKSSNLLLNRPATIILPLSPGEENKHVRVLSCNDRGEWVDITSKVDDVVLEKSTVAFKTKQLSSGFLVLHCGKSVNATKIVNLVTKNVRARRARTVIFKKWKEPREEGIMTARMECVLEEFVEDRVCRTIVKDKYELQEGTPTPPVTMLENETICAIFNGNIRPDVEMVNGMYGVNFKFYCERARSLEFDVKVLDWGKDTFSVVELYPGPREKYHVMSASETAEPATPLAVAGITTPRGPNCPYWLACQRFKNTLEIEGTYFSPDHDKCYCETCHKDRSRGDPDSHLRAETEKKSAVPVGWARFGLSLNPAFKDEDLNVFSKWHRAYHGTKHYSVKKILQGSSILLMPGDVALGGFELGVRPGHITPGLGPDGFDAEQVFVSPSIVYAGLNAYASPERFDDDHEGKAYNARVAFQLCIRPDSYEVGPETVGAGRRPIDPLFSNDDLEWSTKEKGGQALYGLLVKLEAL